MPKLGRDIGKPQKTPLWQIILAWCQAALANLRPTPSGNNNVVVKGDGDKKAGLFNRPEGKNYNWMKVVGIIGLLILIGIVGFAFFAIHTTGSTVATGVAHTMNK